MLGFFVLTVVVVILLRKYLRDLKYRDFDGPSPFLSLPLIGHGYLLGSDVASKLTEYQKKYGDIFRFDIGAYPTVILCTQELVAEAFRKEAFSGRFFNQLPSLNGVLKRNHRGELVYGVVSGEGPEWYEQRKFMLKTLTDLGMGKKDVMEDIISEEAEQLVDLLKPRAGTKIKSKGFFANAANNVIWRICTGKRTKQTDPELTDLTNTIVDIFTNQDPSNPLTLLQMNFLPFIRFLQWLGLPNYADSVFKINNMVGDIVASSKANVNGNYIERGLAECESDGASSNICLKEPSGSLHVEAQAISLFMAGTDTTATGLEWSLLYLIRYPDVQEKVFREISEITNDNDRRVTLSDRPSANYVNAFIDEIARHSPEGTVPPPHKTMQDVVFQGKKIPKGTQVISFGYGVNHDPRHFPDHHLFRPERFLDSSGRYVRDDRVVFFGVGKRKCPGELLARAELFLFMSSLVQRFRLRSTAPPSRLDLMAVVPGTVFYPKQFEFVAEDRGIQFA